MANYSSHYVPGHTFLIPSLGRFPARLRSLAGGIGVKVLVLAVALLVLQTAQAQAAGKGSNCPAGTVKVGTKCGTPVITDIEFFDINQTISDDGLGTYSHADGVLSYLLEDGIGGLMHDWRFDVRGSSTRDVTETVKASDQILQIGEDPITVADYLRLNNPWASKAQLNVQCTAVGVDMLLMVEGDTHTCPLINAFDYNGGNYYGLHPALSWTGVPGTTDVNVTCNADDLLSGGRGCTDWVIEPMAAGAIGQFVKHEVVRKRETTTVLGLFNMRFRIHVTRP